MIIGKNWPQKSKCIPKLKIDRKLIFSLVRILPPESSRSITLLQCSSHLVQQRYSAITLSHSSSRYLAWSQPATKMMIMLYPLSSSILSLYSNLVTQHFLVFLAEHWGQEQEAAEGGYLLLVTCYLLLCHMSLISSAQSSPAKTALIGVISLELTSNCGGLCIVDEAEPHWELLQWLIIFQSDLFYYLFTFLKTHFTGSETRTADMNIGVRATRQFVLFINQRHTELYTTLIKVTALSVEVPDH